MNQAARIWERNRKDLYFALIAAFLWGMLAHAYCFFDNSVSHDSLNEFHAAIFGNDWKMQLGRIFVPVYRDLFRGDATLPWLIGVLSLVWLGIGAFFVFKIFDMKSKPMMLLTAGVLVVNTTVSAIAATYLNDLDNDMFALMCAIGAVYCWKALPRGELLGAVLIMGSLGLYQGFLTVTIALVMMVCILELLNGTCFGKVFAKGLRAIAMILLGGLMYYAAMEIVLRLTGIALTSGDYNSLSKALELTPQNVVSYVLGAYRDWFGWIWNSYSSYPTILVRLMNGLLFGTASLALLVFFLDRKRGLWEKLLGLALLLMMPLAMNIYYVLTLDNNHDLMVYAIWLCYLFVMLLADWLVKCRNSPEKKEKLARCIRALCFVLVFLTVYGSAQFANGMYLKKDLEYDAYLSLMTRVTWAMESHEDYIPGQTPVAMVGLPTTLNQVIPGFKEYWNVIGMEFSDVILQSSPSRYRAYFDYVLNVPVNFVEDDVWRAIRSSEQVKQMPSYPARGFVAMEGDVLVVKLGPVKE